MYCARAMNESIDVGFGALRVAPLEVGSVDALAALLASTFDADEGYRYLFPRADERPRGLTDFFTRNLQVHLPYRCTYVAHDAEGQLLAAVTLRPPGGIPISLATMLRRGLLPFALAHGRAAVKRLFWLKDTYDALELSAARGEPHWHVHMMAVRRDHQGRGVGSALLGRVIDRVGNSKHPTTLTTHLPENVAFYRRASFVVTAEQTLQPPGERAYTVWSMRREQ